MMRVSFLAATAMLGGALLTLGATASHAQAATNIFSLAVSTSNTSNIAALQAGDILTLDVFLTSDATTKINGYQASVAFDTSVFDIANSNFDKSSASKFNSGPFIGSYTNGNSPGFDGILVGGEARTRNGTVSYAAATPTLLGTFSLDVVGAPKAGVTEIRFTDLTPNAPPSQNQEGNSSRAFDYKQIHAHVRPPQFRCGSRCCRS